MNENKERNKYYTFIAIALGVALFAMLICSRVWSANAAEIIPNGDLQDEEYVLVSWDNSVFYAPEPVFTTTISDSQYPSTSVSLSYARVENSRIYFSYYVENEGTFAPDEVRFSVYNSAGNVLQDVWLDNGLSIYDYKVCRGSVVGWTNNLLYYNSSYGFSFADIDTLGYSGNVIYFCSILNNVEYYYAAQVSAGTFSLVHDFDNSETILSADSSAITLFSWDNSDREWIVISLDATEQTLKAYPVDKIIRLQGTSGIYLTYDAWARFDTRYFRDDVTDEPDDPDEPDVDEQEFGVFVQNYNDYYLYLFHGVPISSSSQPPVINGSVNNALSYAVSTYSLGTDFIQPVTFSSGGTFGNMRLFYIPCEYVSDMVVYHLGTSVLSYDIDYIKQYYTGTQSNAFSFNSSLGILAFKVMNYSGWWVYLNRTYNLSAFYLAPSMGYNFSDASLLVYTSSAVNNTPLVTAYRYGLSGAELAPTPTPDPNATPTPEPTPTPTDAPHVIITWPTSTPTPTPVATMPIIIPTSPIGDLGLDTTISVFDTGTDVISRYAQPGLLAFAFSFLPPEIQYLIWFLIFVLVLLAIVRMVIHFGGG